MEIIKGNLYISKLGQIVEALEDDLTSHRGRIKTFNGIVIEGNGYHETGLQSKCWSYDSFKPYNGTIQDPIYEIY